MIGLGFLLVLVLGVFGAGPVSAQAPDGQITWAYHITIAPTWFDPADTPAIITPFTYYYAIHDCDARFANVAEAVVNYLKAVGIRARLRPLERAAFFGQYRDKKLQPIIQSASAAFGNAATRLEAFVAANGMFTYGTYGDIEGLFQEQAMELDVKKREATLHRIQELIHEKVMFGPIWELAFISAHGPRVAESGLGLITNLGFSAPYEELKLKTR